MADNNKKTSNVLCLDGGGVRGLSSLIILRKLLCLVNVEVNDGRSGFEDKPLLPLRVFDLVVGTSTGGLIALMIVKLGMDIDKCIATYITLSEEIFSHWHWMSLFTFGFGRVRKYCGKHLRKVLVEQVIEKHLDRRCNHPEDLLMSESSSHPDKECTVLCREIHPVNGSRMKDPVLLCSHSRPRHTKGKCHSNVKVADAARATSAAPTYFSHVKLLGKVLVDGGFGHTNNPSFEAWDHHFLVEEEYSRIQFVNIGTGRKGVGSNSERDATRYIPIKLLKDLAQIVGVLGAVATDTEQTVRQMEALDKVSRTLHFDVFSADKANIHDIDLGQYKKLAEIEADTHKYLADESVLSQLRKVAHELAVTCLKRRKPLSEAADAIIGKPSLIAPAPIRTEDEGHNQKHDTASTEQETNPGMTDTSSVISASLPVPSAVFPGDPMKGLEAQLLHVGAGLSE